MECKILPSKEGYHNYDRYENKLGTLRARLWWASLPLCFGGLLLFDMALRYFYRFAGSTRFLDWRAFVFSGAGACC